MEIVATIDDGVMKADEQGRFTGSANVNWRGPASSATRDVGQRRLV